MRRLLIKQGTAQWLAERMGRVTASDLKNLVTAKGGEFAPRKWSTEMPNTYLAAKLSEKWRGVPDEGFTSFAMEQGAIREHQAVPWYEGIYEVAIERVGLIIADDGRFAASPDGMFADGAGIECKVPEPKTHVKYLLAGEVPEEYLPQVHGSIFAAGSAYWKFMSWRPEFPKLIVTVERERRILDVIEEVVEDFNSRFDRAFGRLVDMNGGELPPPPQIVEEVDEEGTVTKTLRTYADSADPIGDILGGKR
jgi:hypothetical protein